MFNTLALSFLFSSLLCLFSPPTQPDPLPLFQLPHALSVIPPRSLTAVLPIVPESLARIQSLLRPFLQPLVHVQEVVIVCPHSILSDVRRELQGLFALLTSVDHPDVSLQPWQGPDITSSVLAASVKVATDWVLVMDDCGLTEAEEVVVDFLLHPPNTSLPLGPNGQPQLDHTHTHTRWGRLQPAFYLKPPFVMPRSLAGRGFSTWQALGHAQGHLGGLLISSDVRRDQPRFVFFLPDWEDIQLAAPLICTLSAGSVRILVYHGSGNASSQSSWSAAVLRLGRCNIRYDILSVPLACTETGSPVLSAWLADHPEPIQVIFALQELDPLVSFLISEPGEPSLIGATLIRVPRNDLKYTDWMSTLSANDWKNWHKPHVDVSVITKDRPESLSRLLKSLLNARYFGDSIDLRVNVEQDCDEMTLNLTEHLTWPFGSVFVHRRIIHGGLLPAVVEAWYPKNNDSYGLLLEDDVELSPLFYAWIKMTVLRYRYGELSSKIPHMFGISLYQQKHLELPLEGRQPFDPRTLFSSVGLPDHMSITPYLSQVPCSWGALYFPEHWREFHTYLAARLAETVLMIEDEVVPAVRSNHWSKSWKKFFIELVFLRGYVMLYPNFDDFVSLSTNHLEVGSHVRAPSQEKQDLYLLPLMLLPNSGEPSGLLEMPGPGLPDAVKLPVLNLTGFPTTLTDLLDQGNERRSTLLGCKEPTKLFDVMTLLCINM